MVNTASAETNSDDKGVEFTIKDNVLTGKPLLCPDSNINNVGEIILQILQRMPDFIGQIEAATGRRCTYKEMEEKSVSCAIWLRKQGIKVGDTVAICSSCYFDVYAPFLACLYIGAECAVEYQQLPTRTFHRFLSTTTPKLIFLHNYNMDNFLIVQKELNMNIQRVLFEDAVPNEVSLNEILSKQTSLEIEKFACEKLETSKQAALLLGTSGSTGYPKLAELSHLSLRIMMDPAYIITEKNLICMCTSGIRWITYFWHLFMGLRANMARIIVEDGKDAKYYEKIIRKYKVEYYGTDTNQLRQIYKYGLIKDYGTTNLKYIIFGGSPISPGILQSLCEQLPHIQIMQLYGSTDVANCIAGQTKRCKSGSCGFVRPGIKMKVISLQTGEALGPNKQGEICVQTASQLNQYRNNPEATKKAIDSEGWLHMGDIGFYDEDGKVYVVGRVSEFLKYNDCCLSVTEMEAVLDEHHAVYKSAVISIPNEISGEIPIAVIRKLPNKEVVNYEYGVTKDEIVTYFTNNMPEFYALGDVRFISEFPLTSTGKISKSKLKEMLENGLV